MIRNRFFQLSLLTELILTFFVSERMVQQTSIIVYKYGFPFRYLDVYSKEVVDARLISILSTGNSGINVNIIALIGNLAIIYILLYFINLIIEKKKNK
ncbi:hypothetical protein N496_19975 (plasmid) [Clostridium botulinum A2B3 87]|uniref:hypothetical protein n=1 Tax=Clostridium botulinum TaxID=1491 RepID=UPI0004A596B8|nr:hypothetical protein [Clostridium botulinum]KEI94413.1 hypothetical protein N496_19975 [Clostridium botulinum A2B3 87]